MGGSPSKQVDTAPDINLPTASSATSTDDSELSSRVHNPATSASSATPSMTAEAASSSSSSPNNNTNDKLRHGPCQNQFQLLEKCRSQHATAVQKGRTAQAQNRKTLSLCVSETDLLIACVKKHPLVFQSS